MEGDAREAALAHAIYDAAVRRWMTLEYLLDLVLDTPAAGLEPPVRGALMAGAAQLLLLDRIPGHAAVNESVECVRALGRPGAAGLVNAVLRKIAALRPRDGGEGRRERWSDRRDEIPLSDGSALALPRDLLPEGDAERLAIATSHPAWLLERWRTGFGPETTRRLAMHSLVAPPTILFTRCAAQDLGVGLPPGVAMHEALAPHDAPGSHVWVAPHGLLGPYLAARPDVWVQDPAASAAVALVADLRPRVVIDVCAGQGTKTRQLAATFPESAVVASDVDAQRLAGLRRTLGGASRVEIHAAPTLRERWHGRADLVVLDVPCSNTGVLARRIEARYRCAAGQLGRLTAIQRQIIADAIPLLAPGGRLLYSTCSLEPEENGGQVEWARRWHSRRAARGSALLPRGLPGEPAGTYQDGSFACELA